MTKAFMNVTHNVMNTKLLENNRLLNRKEFLFGVSNETMHSWLNYYALQIDIAINKGTEIYIWQEI